MLLFTSAFTVFLAAFIVETIAYFGGWRWYYQLGPSFHTRQWQSTLTADQARRAIEQAGKGLRIAVRRRGDMFLLRFKWWDLSVWSRAILEVRPGPHGAVLTYQVRPFINPSLFAVGALVLFFSGEIPLFAIGYFVLILFMYVSGWWYEMRKLRRLRFLRPWFGEVGLAICAHCGYDRFQLRADQACPECGQDDTAVP